LPPDPPQPFEFGPPLIGALLRRPLEVVQARMLARLHERGFDDLVPAHLVIMRHPGAHDRRPGEIAAGSGQSKQAINYLLGELERLGYLERRADPDDRRSKRVYLTPRGIEVGMTMREAVAEVEREWAEALGDDDLEQLRALLRRLAAIVRAD
jgi:DNA-binding MarR family transcriptional regulator